MEQRGIWKNVTGTAFVLGLEITSMSFNDTQVISSLSEIPYANYGTLEEEAEQLFGQMREATAQESASVNNYVRSISKDTGVNFFDLC